MFGFKKAHNQLKTTNQSLSGSVVPDGVSKASDDEIYVMPSKFHANYRHQSRDTSLIAVLTVLVIVVIFVGSYFIYNAWQDNQKIVTEIDYEDEGDLRSEQDSASLDAINQNTATSTAGGLGFNADVADQSLATSTSSTATVTPAVSLPILSRDTDNDGLTDLEEGIIGTSPSRPDTDGDGYLDGTEWTSGYSPVALGGGEENKLKNAPFIVTLRTTFDEDNFTLLYLKDWSAVLATATKQAVITANTGEIVKISVKNNTDRVSATDWFLTANPGADISQLKTVTSNTDISGIIAPDGLSAYLTDARMEKLYIFEYLLDRDSEFRYPNFFRLMMESIEDWSDSALNLETAATTTDSLNVSATFNVSI